MTTTEALLDLAGRHRRAGRAGPAVETVRRYAQLEPEDHRAAHLLGTLAFEEGDFDRADCAFRHVIALTPGFPPAYRDLAVAKKRKGEGENAISVVHRAVQVDPTDADGFLLLGQLLARGEARKAFLKAVLLRPDRGQALMSLANALQLEGQFDAAELLYRATITMLPNSAEAHKNMAVALSERGSLDEAEAAIRRAVRYQPSEAAWRMALGQILLLRGRYDEGWKQYEWRWKAGTTRPRSFAQPEWAGEDMRGGVLLLHAEQGLGDTLQFCRYVSLAAARGARVVLEVQPPLKTLMTSLTGAEKVVAAGETLPPFDRHCPLLSLPRLFKTRLDTIPAPMPYLRADPMRRARWKERLAARPGLNIGLVWAGGIVTPRNAQRSIAAGRLAPLAGTPGVNFISLQKYHPGADQSPPPAELDLVDWTDELTDFSDTAALVDALDLVIAVDTAVAHVAGALGKPVWLLNRFFPCWRWLPEGNDSPWYPSLRQFRQPALDDWDSVVAEIRTALELYAAAVTADPDLITGAGCPTS